LALYEHVTGTRPAAVAVGDDFVRQALDFFQAVNALRSHEDAQQLSLVSEACFTVNDHCCRVQQRLDRLRRIEANSDLDAQAVRFVEESLLPAWQSVIGTLRERAKVWRVATGEPLPPEDWCLSPSDFGFHNALIRADGRLVFLDFEYAGWDDPAKTVADFFCQPACPVPDAYFDRFTRTVVANAVDPESHRRRCELLLPVYRLKWCCIRLNDFLPSGAGRRRFACGAGTEAERKMRQLGKAQEAVKAALAPGGLSPAA
jgi:hypothetical protein